MRYPLTVRHRLVGARLRRYRENLGYDLRTAAGILGCDPSKVSRVETGQRGILPGELTALLTEYGVPDAAQRALASLAQPRDAGGWSRDSREIMGDGYADFVIAEAAASHLLVYAPLLVPEPLRTGAYARAAAEADPAVPDGAEDLAAEITMTRQAAVLDERHTGCDVILGEAALHQQAGGTGVLREQLALLAKLPGTYPQLTIRVLPFAAGVHAADGGFSAPRFTDVPDLGLVRITGPRGGICLDDATDISSYARTFTRLSCYAPTPGQSAARIRQALEALTPPSGT